MSQLHFWVSLVPPMLSKYISKFLAVQNLPKHICHLSEAITFATKIHMVQMICSWIDLKKAFQQEVTQPYLDQIQSF